MQNDIMRNVKYFEDFGYLSRGSNSSFISLFPKVKNPLSLNEFHLFSLIACIYKILSKVLSSRIKCGSGLVIDVT